MLMQKLCYIDTFALQYCNLYEWFKLICFILKFMEIAMNK